MSGKYNHNIIQLLKQEKMKTITVTLLLFFVTLNFANAQKISVKSENKSERRKKDNAATNDVRTAQKKNEKDARDLKKQQKADAKTARKNAEANATIKVPSTGTNKNGTPDMRLKVNKQPKTQVAPVIKNQPTPVTSNQPVKTVTNNPTRVIKSQRPPQNQVNNNSSDKVIETDAKGRAIYEGKRGGKYYINKNGNKEYIKRN